MNNGEIAEELNLPESVPPEEQKKIHEIMGSPQTMLMTLRLPLGQKCFPKTELKKSPIHGRGIFAIDRIPRGQIITMYPGDIVKVKTSVGESDQEKLCGFFNSPHLPFHLCRVEDIPNIVSIYGFEINDTYSIAGHPELDEDVAYRGHLINDGARSHSPRDANVYRTVSLTKLNCQYLPILDSHVVIVATRDIQPGEEILATYGYDYWKHFHST